MDTCGNLIGMNFYDHKETPFIPPGYLFPVSASTGDVSSIVGAYRWPLPKPCPYRQQPSKLKPIRIKVADFDLSLRPLKKPAGKCGVIFTTPGTNSKIIKYLDSEGVL
jgi:hypothetical protein